jgi:RsiW-degrading membrane proteinase PrsW (M82 family)
VKIKNSWLKILALSTALPSTIFISAWFLFELSEQGFYPKWVAIVVLLAIVLNTFVLMIYYGRNKKN